MLRVAIVMSHADRSLATAGREFHFALGLQKQNAEVAFFRMHNGSDVEVDELPIGMRAVFAPVDAPHSTPHRLTSASLVEQLAVFRPDFIFFMGLGYDINRFVVERLKPVRFGFIVGGGLRDPILEAADLVLGEYREQIERHFAGHAAKGRALSIPNFVNFAWTDDRDSVATYDIINAGVYDRQTKNPEALFVFRGRYRVAFAGAAKEHERFKSLDHSDQQHFLGWLPQERLYRAFCASRVMVHPSLHDGMPRVVVEAMACGLPVVVYRSTIYGGIQDGETGFMIDPKDLESTVDGLLSDEGLRSRMGRNAAEYAKAHHGPDAIYRTSKSCLEFM